MIPCPALDRSQTWKKTKRSSTGDEGSSLMGDEEASPDPAKACVKGKQGGFPGGPVVGRPPAKAGDMSSVPGVGGSHVPGGS